ncbi:MAG: ThuA domain-containing protein [Anaerolineae bacterium]
MRVLVICDDHWHPISTVREGLTPLEDKGFEFDYIDDAREWSAGRMSDYPVVVLSKSNDVSSEDDTKWMTEEVEQAFLDYVRGGRGLLAVHSGTAGYRETKALRGLLGGVFIEHPPQCPVTVEPEPDHPLTEGSKSFTVKDEHYRMALDDEQADVFLTTSSEHGTEPGGWIRTEGLGRVCVLTPGHNPEVWLHPSYQVLLENALRWCNQT